MHSQDSNISPQNKMFARGGTSDGHCTAFFSVSGPPFHLPGLYTYLTRENSPGICGLLVSVVVRGQHMLFFLNHQPLCESIFIAFVCCFLLLCSAGQSIPGATTHTVAFAPSAAASPLIPQRPVMAFAGLSRPTAVAVQKARRDSIQRTLHGNNPAASSSSGSPATKKRKSGPPRSYSDAPVLPLLDDFAPAAAAAALVTVTVGILPKVVCNMTKIRLLLHINSLPAA